MYSEDGSKLISTYNGSGRGAHVKVDLNPKIGTKIICDHAYDDVENRFADSITIPDTVIALGYNAFGWISVEEITIPSSVKYITGNPFGNPFGYYNKIKCNSKYFSALNDVLMTSDNSIYIANNDNKARIKTIPTGVIIVGRGAIKSHDEVELIRIPSSVIALAEESISLCNNLLVIVFEGMVNIIESGVLRGCKRLKAILVPRGLKQHYQGLLPNEYGLFVVEFSNNQESSDNILHNVLIEEDKKNSLQVVRKSNVKPFVSQEEMSFIKNIKNEYELTEISLIDKEEKVIDWGCLDEEEKIYWKNGLASYSKDGKKILQFEGGVDEYMIRSGVEVICDYAFTYYNNKHFSFPKTTIILGDRLFNNPPFEELIIPESVRKITGNPFATCKVKLHCQSPAFYFDGNVLYDNEKRRIISVIGNFPQNGKDQQIEFCKTVIVIGRNSFNHIFLPRIIVLPDAVVFIGDSAFSNAYINGIKLGKRVLEIGEWAFAFSSIEEMELPDSLEILGNSAFSCCSSLKRIKLSASLTTIAEDTFTNCKNLNNVYIPEGIRIIKKNAFNMCKSLINICFPDSLEKIEKGAFSFCGFKTVVVSKHTIIEEGAFMKDCTIMRRE